MKWGCTFFILVAFRYTRLVVNLYYYYTFQSRRLASDPRFTPEDVSVVVPTKFSNPPEHIQCIRQILACGPREVVVVTADCRVDDVCRSLFAANLLSQVILLSVEKLEKRQQMTTALRKAVSGDICCFADDDVQWPSTFLPTMLACFEDESVGAAGPSQRVQRFPNASGFVNLWNFLGVCYLERRNFMTGATNHVDGSVSTLSGRTSFYLTKVIQNQDFFDYFLHSDNHDDDKNLTRWTFIRGWKIALQFDPAARIETTLETDCMGFLNQCARWSRGHWRGNFRVMQSTSYWWNVHRYSLYQTYIGQFQTPAFAWDGFMTYALLQAIAGHSIFQWHCIFSLWVSWAFFTKIVKIIPHFMRNKKDLVWLPFMIGFSYFHGVLNLYCLWTKESKGWGAKKSDTDEKTHLITAASTTTP
ncbi:nucleotide-diphospho-sugar transferase [Delphinella strobiligena]|nr:nucleotide-diphospho-sugar transferase [Delphinella strobiligena]